jgi:hypothetical protein
MGDAALMLDVLEGSLAVARLRPDEPPPQWASGGPLCAVARTAQELSVVCPSGKVPAGVRQEDGFRAMVVRGPLDFATTGVVSALSAPLAQAGIPIFVMSTFDTDYLLVREALLDAAVSVLRDAGHEVFTASAGGEVV